MASGLTLAGAARVGGAWMIPITVAAYLTWFEIEHPYMTDEDRRRAALGRTPELRPPGTIRREGINEPEPEPVRPGGPPSRPKPPPAPPPPGSFFDPEEIWRRTHPGRALGGAIFGAGGPTSDKVPAWLSNGEHVLTAKDVKALGGQGAVYGLRNMLHGFRAAAPSRESTSPHHLG